MNRPVSTDRHKSVIRQHRWVYFANKSNQFDKAGSGKYPDSHRILENPQPIEIINLIPPGEVFYCPEITVIKASPGEQW